MGVDQVPLWLKLGYTGFVCVLVPVYLVHYGPRNFLWFSDIALFVGLAAVWLESSLLASMMAVAIAVPELAWNADFFTRLLTGRQLLGLSTYMFDATLPLYLRALSLFHVWMPVVLLWLVYRLGYDRRAWLMQSAVALIVLPLTYWVTDPADNINWVYGPGTKPQTRVAPGVYLLGIMVFFPIVMYLPAHWLFTRLWGR